MGICYKNYKRKQNWNENEQKINTKRKCNIMQRDTPNTKAIFDLPAIKNTKSVLNTLVHIIFLRLFSLYISLFLYIFVDHFLPRCRENECESPLYACSVSLCFKRTFWHILWEIHQKAFSYLIHVNCSKNLIAFVPPLAITNLSRIRLFFREIQFESQLLF